MTKKTLRSRMKDVREQLHQKHNVRGAKLLAANLLSLDVVQKAGIVAGYYPIQSELDIIVALKALHAAHHPIALPVMTGPDSPLLFRGWDFTTPLVEGPFGVREPAADVASVIPDVVLVPLLAFDDQGQRLGYGGGFYDRTFAHLKDAVRIGVAFEGQKIEAVPTESYDQGLDYVITEQKTYSFDRL